MEDFYRWRRRRLDILIDSDGEPVGGRWNYDDENRLSPPKGEHEWPAVIRRTRRRRRVGHRLLDFC